MREVVVKISGWLLCLIGFGGVAACSSENIEYGAPEYGSPYSSYEIKGKVTDEEGVPVKGIKVTCDILYEGEAYTGEDGRYSLSGEGFPVDPVRVTFNDVDGEQNGGSFAEKTVEAEPVKVSDGSGSWYFGSWEVEADAELTPEQEQTSEE